MPNPLKNLSIGRRRTPDPGLVRLLALGSQRPRFLPSEVNFVLLVTVICFLRDPFQALRETRRVLKPQGRVIIGTIDQDSPLGKGYEAKKPESAFYSQASFYPIREVLAWLRSLGYANFQSRQTIFKSILQITDLEPVQNSGMFVVIAGETP